MPLSTVLFRVGRLEARGATPSESRTPTTAGRTWCASPTRGNGSSARLGPRFRAYAEAVEARLGGERIGQLRDGLGELREAMEQEVSPE